MEGADRERLIKVINAAAVPLEVLAGQINTIPYKELSPGLQAEIMQAVRQIREVVKDLATETADPASATSTSQGMFD